jgi:phage tail protein X
MTSTITATATTTAATTAATMRVMAMQGDTLDKLCWRTYGENMLGTSVLEQALALNHGLADLGEVLPLGTQVTLPVLPSAATQTATIQLWE